MSDVTLSEIFEYITPISSMASVYCALYGEMNRSAAKQALSEIEAGLNNLEGLYRERSVSDFHWIFFDEFKKAIIEQIKAHEPPLVLHTYPVKLKNTYIQVGLLHGQIKAQ